MSITCTMTKQKTSKKSPKTITSTNPPPTPPPPSKRSRDNTIGWCVTVVEAIPEDTDPYSTTTVRHFKGENDARRYARYRTVQKWIECGLIDSDEEEKFTNMECEKFWEIVDEYDDKLYDVVYKNVLMDMPPLDVTVKKIKFK